MAGAAAIDLGTRFEIRGLLGRGGMGSVFEAFDRERREVVALKTMDRLEPLSAVRLKHEFRVLRGITHPNLVTFYELHEHEGRLFITMERVDGVSFTRWVRPDGADGEGPTRTGTSGATIPDVGAAVGSALEPVAVGALRAGPERPAFDEARLRSSLLQLARGLSAIHRAERVHRDVKPSNVRVTPEGRVVVLDFGITASRGEGGEGAGTVAYMAPEQMGDERLDPAADWYAAGTLLFEALTGHLPFSGNAAHLLYLKTSRDAPKPSDVAAPLPEDLERLCVGLLSRAPERRPDARQVFRVVSERRVERADPAPRVEPPLVGREPVMRSLFDAYDEASLRGPLAVRVEGAPGSGRSRVLEELGDRLEARGALVLRGQVDAREAIAYRGVDQVVEALARADREGGRERGEGIWLGSLFPSVWTALVDPKSSVPPDLADPAEQRRRAFALLGRWVARVSAERAVAILVDDADRLGEAGAALLASLLSPPDPTSVFMAFTTTEGAPVPDALVDVPTLPLPPLSGAALRELAGFSLASAAAPAALDALVGLSRGRPGVLVELAADLRGLGATAVDLELTVTRRLARLEAPVRELLELTALCFAPMDTRTAAAVTSAAREAVAARLEALRRAHLVVRSPRAGTTAFRLPALVERVAAANVEPTRRPGLHARLADALERTRPMELSAIARHRLEAGQPGRAVAPLIAAARDAEACLAFESLAQLCALAERANPGARVDWIVRRARAHGWAGRAVAAGSAYLEAARLAGPTREQLRYRILAAGQLLRGGHLDQGLDELRVVLDAVGVSMPRTALGALPALLARRAQLLLRGYGYRETPAESVAEEDLLRVDACWTAAALLNVDIYLGAYFQTLYILYALRAGEPGRVARGLAMEAPLLAAAGRAARAAELTTEAERLARDAGDVRALGLVRGTAGLALVQAGRWREARVELERAERHLRERCPGAFWELVTAQVAYLWSLAYLGELRTMRRALHVCRASAQGRGDVFGATNLGVGMPTLAWLLDDDEPRARLELEEAMSPWSREGFHVQHFFHRLSEVMIHLYAGEGSGAFARLEDLGPRVRRSQLLRNQLLRCVWHDLSGRACLATGRVRDARRHASRIERERAPWAAALSELLRAGAARLASDDAGCGAHLDRASASAATHGLALHEAVAQHALAPLGRGVAFHDSEWVARERPANPDALLRLFAPAF